VVRGGYRSLTQTVLGPTAYAFTGVHASDIRTYTNFQGKGKPPLFTLPQVFGRRIRARRGWDGGLHRGGRHPLQGPRSHQWNLTVERELPAAISLRTTYLGSHSVGLNLTDDLNQQHASAIPFNNANRPIHNGHGYCPGITSASRVTKPCRWKQPGVWRRACSSVKLRLFEEPRQRRQYAGRRPGSVPGRSLRRVDHRSL